MKNTTTLKSVLAALTLTGMSSLPVVAAQPTSGVKVKFINERDVGGRTIVTIYAKQSDGTKVKKGTMTPPTERGIHIFYPDDSFFFNPTDIIRIHSDDSYSHRMNAHWKALPSCEIKVSDVKPNAPIIIGDYNCQQK